MKLKIGKKCYKEYEEVKFPVAVKGSKIAGYMVGKKFYPKSKVKFVKNCSK